MNWLNRIANFMRPPSVLGTIESLAALDENAFAEQGNHRYASMIRQAKKAGLEVTKRKRAGNFIIVVKIPAKDGHPPMKIRLKFKEKQ